MNSYPKIFNLGHRALANLFDVPVCVEEKVDGSQISFGVLDGELHVRSRGAVVNVDAPDNMFSLGVEKIKEVKGLLKPGFVYRGEYLRKPKHNTLTYNRVPTNHIMVFDIQDGDESYLNQCCRSKETARIGFEEIPVLWNEEQNPTLDDIKKLLERESVLGGVKIEGVVVKPKSYLLFGEDKKILMGKYVSEGFKEKQGVSWKADNPSSQDVVTSIGESYRTPARWEKAIQHLREEGKIQDSPKDIGALILEIKKDLQNECVDEIKEALWAWAWPHIQRKVVFQFAEFYKEQLLKQQFEKL